MSRPRARRTYRPCLDRLEDYCLLSIGLPLTPGTHALVNKERTEARSAKPLPTTKLLGTQIATDLYRYMLQNLPSSDRGRVQRERVVDQLGRDS